MNKGYTKQSLDSEKFFKSIVNVEFLPMTEDISLYHKPKHRKGDVIYKRSLLTGFRKKIKKIFTEDIWECENGYFFAELNIQEYAERYGLLVVDGKLYSKPVIRIETTNKDNNRVVKFNSDDEAIRYLKELKEKCKLCENNLI